MIDPLGARSRADKSKLYDLGLSLSRGLSGEDKQLSFGGSSLRELSRPTRSLEGDRRRRKQASPIGIEWIRWYYGACVSAISRLVTHDTAKSSAPRKKHDCRLSVCAKQLRLRQSGGGERRGVGGGERGRSGGRCRTGRPAGPFGRHLDDEAYARRSGGGERVHDRVRATLARAARRERFGRLARLPGTAGDYASPGRRNSGAALRNGGWKGRLRYYR
jgi:hypothetical protein